MSPLLPSIAIGLALASVLLLDFPNLFRGWWSRQRIASHLLAITSGTLLAVADLGLLCDLAGQAFSALGLLRLLRDSGILLELGEVAELRYCGLGVYALAPREASDNTNQCPECTEADFEADFEEVEEVELSASAFAPAGGEETEVPAFAAVPVSVEFLGSGDASTIDPLFDVRAHAWALDVLARSCHQESRNAGWYTDLKTGAPLERNLGEMLMLCVSELSEAFEGVRKGQADKHLPHRSAEEVEIADLLIRVFDYAGYRGLDLALAVAEKVAYNRERADHKIENRKAPGGKAF